ncbi:hypothetical protein C0Q70_00786 [Pomacea canaliculata]|uniref:Uncharacterized protein n=1 Tax=Pomacea canaliculata TaxID=400727 RepID=A0A2T7PXM1_POMCA|nr:hypothetical protein C0Q70_00786 [Pomacea canaliculata]
MKNVYLYVNLFKTGAFVVTRDRPGAAREGLGVTLPPRVSEVPRANTSPQENTHTPRHHHHHQRSLFTYQRPRVHTPTHTHLARPEKAQSLSPARRRTAHTCFPRVKSAASPVTDGGGLQHCVLVASASAPNASACWASSDCLSPWTPYPPLLHSTPTPHSLSLISPSHFTRTAPQRHSTSRMRQD